MKRLQTSFLTLLLVGGITFAAWPTTASEEPPPAEETPAFTLAATQPRTPPVTTTAAPTPTQAPTEPETPTEPPSATEDAPEPPYTEQDITMLAQMVWGEARGCAKAEQALCVWTVINRLEDGRFGKTLQEVLTKPYQFAGYSPNNPVTDEIKATVEDALAAWARG